MIFQTVLKTFSLKNIQDLLLLKVNKVGDTMSGNLSFAAGKGTPNNIITESTTARTLALADAYGYVRTTSASATTITVPLNAAVPFGIGSQIDFFQKGAGAVTFTPISGVTINSYLLTISSQYKAATLIKVATNEWDLIIG